MKEKKSPGSNGRNDSKRFRPEKQSNKNKKREPEKEDDLVRLNKFIANAGVCSRREADKLIESGVIKINDKIITNLGTKVGPEDIVKYEDKVLKSQKKHYVLLNKPKGYLTTTDDPYERKTVMMLVRSACKERIYPVGRLDKDTTGLLLFTNDGTLAKKLTHPKHQIRKVYHVILDKALTKVDFGKIAKGIVLEDGIIQVDKLAYVNSRESKNEIGIELHSGRNRIIRRIFESLDYKVTKLDRVSFASLTKKDVPRGKWRTLTEQEVNYLKML